MVVRGDVQLGVGRSILHPDVELLPVFRDQVLLVVSAHHRFAEKHRVRIEDLANERLILFDRLSSYHDMTSAMFRSAAVVPRSVMEMDNVEAAKKMVQLDLGVAFLPRMALTDEFRSGSLRSIRIVGVRPLWQPVVAMRRRDAGRPTGALAELLMMLAESKLANEPQ
jgi:DNA-binding transcriptional LysR family regulator